MFAHARPAARAKDEDELVTARLYSRWYRLRQQKLVPPLLLGDGTHGEYGKLYKFDPISRWNGREAITRQEFVSMIEEGEALLAARKPIMSEQRALAERIQVAACGAL